MSSDEIVAALTREIVKRGGRIGGKHRRLTWTLGPCEFVEIVAATPSDQRAIFNARARIRRQLKVAVEQRRKAARG